MNAGALLNLVEVPLNSFVLHHSNDYTMISVIHTFGKCALDPIIRVTNEDVKQHWPQYQFLESAITNHLPLRLWKVDHYTLNLIVWPVSNLLCTPLIQPSNLATMILWETMMKSFLKTAKYIPHVHRASHFTIEGQQVGLKKSACKAVQAAPNQPSSTYSLLEIYFPPTVKHVRR